MTLPSKRRKVILVKRLTVYGGYNLAISRNLGHSSCRAVLDILDAGIKHHQTVSRWELMLATNVHTQSQLWYSEMYSRVDDFKLSSLQNCFSWEVNAIRGDATNSSTLQNHKVHVAEIATMFRIPVEGQLCCCCSL